MPDRWRCRAPHPDSTYALHTLLKCSFVLASPLSSSRTLLCVPRLVHIRGGAARRWGARVYAAPSPCGAGMAHIGNYAATRRISDRVYITTLLDCHRRVAPRTVRPRRRWHVQHSYEHTHHKNVQTCSVAASTIEIPCTGCDGCDLVGWVRRTDRNPASLHNHWPPDCALSPAPRINHTHLPPIPPPP